jgi:hypothetical protein
LSMFSATDAGVSVIHCSSTDWVSAMGSIEPPEIHHREPDRLAAAWRGTSEA